jgi:hypothetical protein
MWDGQPSRARPVIPQRPQGWLPMLPCPLQPEQNTSFQPFPPHSEQNTSPLPWQSRHFRVSPHTGQYGMDVSDVKSAMMATGLSTLSPTEVTEPLALRCKIIGMGKKS